MRLGALECRAGGGRLNQDPLDAAVGEFGDEDREENMEEDEAEVNDPDPIEED